MTTPTSTARAPQRTIGVAEFAFGADSGLFVTGRLGSGIGVSVYDPVRRVGGMLHFLLALAEDRDLAVERPAMFGVSGVSTLLRSLVGLGAVRERLVICAVGGAGTIEESEAFGIGARNRAILTKMCWKAGLPLVAEDTGGVDARQLSLDLATGTVRLQKRGREEVLWRA